MSEYDPQVMRLAERQREHWEEKRAGGPYAGMTLRDYFAAAMAWPASRYKDDPEEIAERAYRIADAMLKERAK